MSNDWLERRLGARLRAVAALVQGEVVADVGSDHGLLPAFLLRSGQVRRVIVVEKHAGPYERACRALAGVAAEVRLGDGLAPLAAGEVECAVLSGFGARAMVAILEAHPECVPARVVAQPNHSPELVAAWAGQAGFRVLGEWRVEDRFPLLALGR